MTKNKYLGPTFDSFLEEEGIKAEVEAIAWKRIIAYQLSQEMKKKKVSQTSMAKKMGTSRAALKRILDPINSSMTFLSLSRAALALGKQVEIKLAPIKK